MRWDRLFDDLEAQLDAVEAAELAGEVADRTRRETASVTMLERLRAATDADVELCVAGAGTVAGRLQRCGPDWLLLEVVSQPAILVTAAAVTSVRDLPRAADVAPLGAVSARLDLRFVLGGISRDRSSVLVSGTDGSSYAGTIDRVGADFIDLAEHPAGEPRRAGGLAGSRTVAIAGLAVVRADARIDR